MSRFLKKPASLCFAALLVSVMGLVFQPSLVSFAQVIQEEDAAVEIPNFLGCVSLLTVPGDFASYATGLHEILGLGLREGSDDVYSQLAGNAAQCYCPLTDSAGIQTNWWKTELIGVTGWVDIANGADWGLDPGHYLAMNSDFECDGGSSGGGGSTIRVVKIIDDDGDLLTTDDRTPGSGWEFEIAGNSAVTNSSGETVEVAASAGTHAVSEIVKNEFVVVDAACLGADNNGSFENNSVVGIEVAAGGQAVVCIFYNMPSDVGGGSGGGSGGGGGPLPIGNGNPDNPAPPLTFVPDLPQNIGSVLGATNEGGVGGAGIVAALPKTGISVAAILFSSISMIMAPFFFRKIRRSRTIKFTQHQ